MNPLSTQDPPESGYVERRILLVDDHPAFAEGIKAILARDPFLKVCGETDSAAPALDAFRELKPDMVLVDISLAGVNGIELIKMLIAEEPQTQILVLSMHDESLYAARAIRAGARGYLMKSEPPDTILHAVRRVANGRMYVSPNLGEQLIYKALQSLKEGLGSPVDALSDRELEILECFGRGFSTKAIADRLHLSPKTVETHRAHIKQKLKLADASALIRFATDWVANCGADSAEADSGS